MSPSTEAGRRLLSEKHSTFHAPLRGCVLPCSMGTAIGDIEAEARAALLAELKRDVEGLPVHYRRNGFANATAWITRRAVLDLIRKAGGT